MKYCPDCGSKIGLGAQSCATCAEQPTLPSPASSDSRTASKPSQSKWILPGLAFTFLVVVGGAIALLLWPHNQAAKDPSAVVTEPPTASLDADPAACTSTVMTTIERGWQTNSDVAMELRDTYGEQSPQYKALVAALSSNSIGLTASQHGIPAALAAARPLVDAACSGATARSDQQRTAAPTAGDPAVATCTQHVIEAMRIDFQTHTRQGTDRLVSQYGTQSREFNAAQTAETDPSLIEMRSQQGISATLVASRPVVQRVCAGAGTD